MIPVPKQLHALGKPRRQVGNAFAKNIANWRGRVLAVLDLRPLLTAPQAAFDRRARLVVLHRNGVSVGVLTEGVEGTHWLDSEALEPALAHLPDSASDLLLGQTTDAGGPCGVIDMDALYRLTEALPRARRAG